MGLITGEYQVYGVPGRLRPLGPPTGAPGGRGVLFPLDPLFLGRETCWVGTRVPRMKTSAPLWAPGARRDGRLVGACTKLELGDLEASGTSCSSSYV